MQNGEWQEKEHFAGQKTGAVPRKIARNRVRNGEKQEKGIFRGEKDGVGIPVAAGGLGEGAAGTERVGGEEVGLPSVGDEVEGRHAGGVIESHFRSDPGTSVGNVGEVHAAHEQETEAHEQKPPAKGCRPTAGEGDARKEEQVGKADGKEGGMDRQHTAG